GGVDAERTAGLRTDLRRRRVASAAPGRPPRDPAPGPDAPDRELTFGPVVWRGAADSVECAGCRARLCGRDENWKEHVLAVRGNAAERLARGEFGTTYRVYAHERVELAELFCPSCSALLSVELYLRGEPYRRDYAPLGAARSAGYDAEAEYAQDPDSWISFE
ncbi:MAG TPA: acetone carboxylase subunit gamma, partial [Gaiellaceae bacterium]|nr:acetone carboxylase subunit gamma [Gaiellaceae bacterium]